MGGLARRVGYATALKAATAGEVPLLQADAGHAFSDLLTPQGMAADVRTKNDYVLRGLDSIDVAAINVSHRDLPYLSTMLATNGYEARLKAFPALGRLVSANVEPVDPKTTKALQPYVVREVRGKRIGTKPLRVGFLGLTEVAGTEVEGLNRKAVGGYRITDPVEAAKKYVPILRKSVDLIVVLGYVGQDTAKRIGTEAPGIDTIVAARQYGLFNSVDEAGDAVVGYVTNQTKWLSEFRFYQDEKTHKVANYLHRDVPLDTVIPDDPDAHKLVEAARDAFTKDQRAAVPTPGAETAQLLKQRAAYLAASPYAGSESCATCHAEEYKVWNESKHAHAFATLEAKDRQLDASCTVCHTVGQGTKGGFRTASLTPALENVQCESCHGAGKQHEKNQSAPYGAVTTPAACVTCHTRENSPDFDFPKYWAKIKHGHGEQAGAAVPAH